MKHVLLTSLAIIMLALAGCSQVDDTTPQSTDGTQTQDSEDDGADGGNQTQDGGSGEQDDEQDDEPASNTPPTAELVADLLNGSAPLTVNFTVDGSDADGDNLTWQLSLNGTVFANGTQLPGDANVTFEAAGNFTVLLAVSDGVNTTTANLTITVADAGGADTLEDRGWYTYDAATGLCHVKEYDDVEGLGVLYNAPLSGGDWYIAETNDVPGLQIDNNHPAAPAGSTPVGSFAVDTPDCADGDQIVL